MYAYSALDELAVLALGEVSATNTDAIIAIEVVLMCAVVYMIASINPCVTTCMHVFVCTCQYVDIGELIFPHQSESSAVCAE